MPDEFDEFGENSQMRTRQIRLPDVAAKSSASGGECLVVVYARGTGILGRRFLLEPVAGTLWAGRGADNTIRLESETCSRKHARFEFRGQAWWVVDNGSTNGTFVNEEPVDSAKLARGDLVRLGDTIFKFLAGSDVEVEFARTIASVMVTDGLTQAHNRQYFDEQLVRELDLAQETQKPLALLLFDIDKFKVINDEHGHLAGDYVLRELAKVVRANQPDGATFARYGGEEFALIVPGAGRLDALAVAEEIRSAVERRAFKYDRDRIAVTVSVGVAVADASMRTAADVVKPADANLYAAKRAGRNRVVA